MINLFFLIICFTSISFAKIKVGVVDMGVHSHPDIQRNIKESISFVKDLKEDNLDHGTYMAGTIVRDSMVKDLEIYSIKNINQNQKVPSLLLKKVVDYAIEKNIKILNISEEMGILSPEDFLAIKKAEKKGIILVVAAGNDKKELTEKTSIFPCQYNLPNVLCVGAYEHKGNKMKILSNYGKNAVDVFAPGGDILGINSNNTYSIMSGSSVATAQVTALLSNVWSNNRKLKYEEAISLMKSKMINSKDLKKFSKTGLYIPYSK